MLKLLRSLEEKGQRGDRGSGQSEKSVGVGGRSLGAAKVTDIISNSLRFADWFEQLEKQPDWRVGAGGNVSRAGLFPPAVQTASSRVCEQTRLPGSARMLHASC